MPWRGVHAERRHRGAARVRRHPDRGHQRARRAWARSRPPATAPTCSAGSTAPPTRAMVGAMIADEPSGRVFGARAPSSPTGSPRPTNAASSRAIEAMARVLLAAGASEVELGGGAPAVRSRGGAQAAIAAARRPPPPPRRLPPERHRGGRLRPRPPPGRPGRPAARRRGRMGRRRLDPAQLPRGQPPGLDHGDGRRRRRGRGESLRRRTPL